MDCIKSHFVSLKEDGPPACPLLPKLTAWLRAPVGGAEPLNLVALMGSCR